MSNLNIDIQKEYLETMKEAYALGIQNKDNTRLYTILACLEYISESGHVRDGFRELWFLKLLTSNFLGFEEVLNKNYSKHFNLDPQRKATLVENHILNLLANQDTENANHILILALDNFVIISEEFVKNLKHLSDGQRKTHLSTVTRNITHSLFESSSAK